MTQSEPIQKQEAELEPLNKVLPAGEPIYHRKASPWVCAICGVSLVSMNIQCPTQSCRAGICPVTGERD